jgi:hypothetical protein
MLEPKSQQELADYFNSHFLERVMHNDGWFFHLKLTWVNCTEEIEYAVRAPLCQITSKRGSCVMDEVTDTMLIICLGNYKHNGCSAHLKDIDREILDRETIEGNYAMLSEEQKQAVMADDRYGQYEQMLAVAALKRRLDFLENKTASYDSELFSIETERAGRGLRIKWRFKPKAKRGGYDIMGFRRTGGFFANEWDEANNGALVIQSSKDGETVELLREGEAQFYTFFAKPWKESARNPCRSPLRFQVTIATKEETDPIRAALETIERQSFNPPTHNLSRALKELGLFVEFDNAIEQREKILARQIETAGYAPQEKQEKLSRLREVTATVRDKYSQ